MGTLLSTVIMPIVCAILATVLGWVTYIWQRNDKLHTQIRDTLGAQIQALAILTEKVQPLLNLSEKHYRQQREIDKLSSAVDIHSRGLREIWHILNQSGIRSRFGHSETDLEREENHG